MLIELGNTGSVYWYKFNVLCHVYLKHIPWAIKKKNSLTIAEKGKSKFCNWHNQIILPDLKESNFRYVHCREIYRRMWFTFLYSLFSHFFAAEFEKLWLFCKFSCYNSVFLNFTPNTLKKEPFYLSSVLSTGFILVSEHPVLLDYLTAEEFKEVRVLWYIRRGRVSSEDTELYFPHKWWLSPLRLLQENDVY